MKASAIKHDDTELFQPVLKHGRRQVVSALFSDRRFETKAEAITFAEEQISDMRRMKNSLVMRGAVVLTPFVLAVLFDGHVGAMLTLATIALGFELFLKGESRLGKWLDSLFALSSSQ